MSDQMLARLGAVMCLPLIGATWHQGDYGAMAWFAFCCGFFFNEQLSPTDGADSAPPKVRHINPNPDPAKGRTP